MSRWMTLILILLSSPALAAQCGDFQQHKGLTSYQSNLLGYTFDADDENYMDFRLSLKYPLLRGLSDSLNRKFGSDAQPAPWVPCVFLSFTGRFGQYIGTRDSSPVLGKQFNPGLFGRWWLSEPGEEEGYLDIGLFHESNGQSINTEEGFNRRVFDMLEKGDSRRAARDSISRGWDYIGATLRYSGHWDDGVEKCPVSIIDDASGQPQGRKFGCFSAAAEFRYFLENGPFQGEAENYYAFEGEGNYLRKDYDGLMFSVEYIPPTESISHLAFSYRTGYGKPFQHSTFKVEARFHFGDDDLPPLLIWYQQGYNSDLVDYFTHSRAIGIAIEITSFD